MYYQRAGRTLCFPAWNSSLSVKVLGVYLLSFRVFALVRISFSHALHCFHVFLFVVVDHKDLKPPNPYYVIQNEVSTTAAACPALNCLRICWESVQGLFNPILIQDWTCTRFLFVEESGTPSKLCSGIRALEVSNFVSFTFNNFISINLSWLKGFLQVSGPPHQANQ
jgi:hypothetical protein